MYFVQNPMHPIFLGAFLIDDAACIVRWTLTLAHHDLPVPWNLLSLFRPPPCSSLGVPMLP